MSNFKLILLFDSSLLLALIKCVPVGTNKLKTCEYLEDGGDEYNYIVQYAPNSSAYWSITSTSTCKIVEVCKRLLLLSELANVVLFETDEYYTVVITYLEDNGTSFVANQRSPFRKSRILYCGS